MNDDFRSGRRRFLELVVVSAGAALASTACGDGEESARERSGTASSRLFPQSVASGDPRPTSVVLWTRLHDPSRAGDELELELVVARDAELTTLVTLDGQARRRLVARAADDGCVKVRLTGLEPGTTYFYRFEHVTPDGAVATSRVGRTKTAPAEGSDAAVRFAALSCQDYDGKYFYAYELLATLDVDFVVHLGDYVYESGLGAPRDGEPRRVVFDRPDEALGLGAGGGAPLVARSLDNYRNLYRTTRSDPDLQAVHERFPFIVIPDDHEFADDSHGATATHRNGAEDETDGSRRRNADHAWFDFMPVDYATAPARELDLDAEFPDDFRVYRSFAFGRHLELVMSDLRRYRPDHLIPEDAFPGAIFLSEAERAEDGIPADAAVPYIDVDQHASGAYRAALVDAAPRLGFDPEHVHGRLSVPWINAALARSGSEQPEPIEEDDPTLERGLAVHQLLKTEPYSRVGSRYFVALEPFEALSRRRFRETNGASERLMGDEQRAWFLETLQRSTRTFKVWGSQIAFLQKHLDLRTLTLAPPELRQRITLSAEDWDGFPNERRELLRELGGLENVVVLSGDLHCFFAATPFDPEQPSRRITEFTIGSVTSTTWTEGIQSLVADDPTLPEAVKSLAPLVGALLASQRPPANPHLAFHELGRNGFALIDVSADAFEVELKTIAPSSVSTRLDDYEVEALFSSVRFRVTAGSAVLERPAGEGFERWDVDRLAWVPA